MAVSSCTATVKIVDGFEPVGSFVPSITRFEDDPLKIGADKLFNVDKVGCDAVVACDALFALADLSFQHPTVDPDNGAAPLHVDDENNVDTSAPSSQSDVAAPVMIVAG